MKISEVSNLPNLGAAFFERQLNIQQILDLRYSKHAQTLRDWLANGGALENQDEVTARYLESLQPGWIQSFPAKAIRFAATTAFGIAAPAILAGAGLPQFSSEIGLAATTSIAVADTFMVDKWFSKKSPALFMDQAKTVLENSPSLRGPRMRGRDRNALCSCGSGKKYKSCCGR